MFEVETWLEEIGAEVTFTKSEYDVEWRCLGSDPQTAVETTQYPWLLLKKAPRYQQSFSCSFVQGLSVKQTLLPYQ